MIRMTSLVGRTRAGTPAAGSDFVPATAVGLFDALHALLARACALPAGGDFPWGPLEQLLARTIDVLETSSSLVWAAHAQAAPGADPLAFHHARAAVLAVRLGQITGQAGGDLLQLGLAACLFDTGLAAPTERVLRDGEASEDDTAYRQHPQRSVDTVRGWRPPAAGILTAILQHHEREQGQGYPRGLRGDTVHPHAKIIGLVDTYLRLMGPREPHRAICQIVRRRHETFPAPLVKALVDEVSVFPPGTVIRLNTGEVGTVVAVSRNHPLRPKVELTTDARGRPVPPRVVDLREAPFLCITGPV